MAHQFPAFPCFNKQVPLSDLCALSLSATLDSNRNLVAASTSRTRWTLGPALDIPSKVLDKTNPDILPYGVVISGGTCIMGVARQYGELDLGPQGATLEMGPPSRLNQDSARLENESQRQDI